MHLTESDYAGSHWDQKYEQGVRSLENPDRFFVTAFESFVTRSFRLGGDALDWIAGSAPIRSAQ
jgi:hypothetical protein